VTPRLSHPATVQERTQRGRLTAHLLGTFQLAIDENPVDVTSSRRIRSLIAYLLTHRRAPVPRDVLMDVFWPAADPISARNSLHVALSGARRVLRAAWPEPVVERRFDAYQIAGSLDVWTDVEHFERACTAAQAADRAGDVEAADRAYEAACQLYEGDFFADEPYTEWTLARRDGLRLLAVQVQSRLVETYTGRSHYGLASMLGRRILAMDPCNEEAHRRLMACYAVSGQRHLALFQYHQMATTLWETLRVKPSAETSALYQRLRQPGTTNGETAAVPPRRRGKPAARR
jgi:SARP family transcriptional regulator, regulator of embCAB operon